MCINNNFDCIIILFYIAINKNCYLQSTNKGIFK